MPQTTVHRLALLHRARHLAMTAPRPPTCRAATTAPTTTWDGTQLPSHTSTTHTQPACPGSGSQQDFMRKDQCILVDDHDVIVGNASKYSAHRFTQETPHGLLHRAFSVFLFNSENKLLLQQRAAHKITFPSVWTNTCCSHPLYGQTPDEVDTPADVASGRVPGARAAAIRKLAHELGVPAHQIPPDAFRFLTRLHYCAPDTQEGVVSEWGEHEMDYILVARADVDVAPNPEEVDAVRYVTLAELQDMMRPESGLRWSPWFRIIAEHFLAGWWAELDTILEGEGPLDPRIHKIM